MVSMMEKGWCGIILLRGKEDKEKGKRHFVNPMSVVWVGTLMAAEGSG